MSRLPDVEVVHCHAGGEVGDVVVAGIEPPPGDTLWAQSRHIAEDGRVRNFLLNEPRGGVFRHANLLVPPVHPDADAAFIIMEPADTPPMSGSNTICVATVLLETGIVAMQEPETRLLLEAPGGLIDVQATCRDGKVERVRFNNLPCFADRLDQQIDVDGIGTLTVDTAWGGDSFVIVDVASTGLAIEPGNARQLAELGVKITAAANEQLGFEHPTLSDYRHISFCLFTTPVEGSVTQHAVAIRPGKIDRSPTGTGVSARLATLHARGLLGAGDELAVRSIIGSVFEGKIERVCEIGGRPAIVPSVAGRGFMFGTSRYPRHGDDPWPEGYRLNDTWPG